MIISCAASPAPTITTSLPRATSDGRLRPLDDRPREHPRRRDEGETEEPVEDPDDPRHGDDVDVEEAEDEEGGERRCGDSAERSPHVARRDVAPPAVVEAGEREDRELDRDEQTEDREVEVAVVVDRDARVEAELEGEQPGRDDDRQVRRQLRQAMPGDRESHAAAGAPTALRTTSTTRSCCSAAIPAQSGTEKLSRATCSVTGRSPSA